VIEVHYGDNLEVIRSFPDESFDLIYIDPPFNTGKVQARTQIQTVQDTAGDRVGFKGKKYRTVQLGSRAYSDSFDDYMAFLEPRLEESRRLLKPDGSFFFHIDYREVHYCKVLLDAIYGRESFVNEIIWAYDYGARATKRWSPKHDNILWYAKNPKSYTYRYDDIDRIPYMAPGLVGPEKAERGKTPTDTWWNTIVSPNGKEKTGYPTQKPLAIINRIIRVHTNPGDRVLDFFAGSGTTGESAFSSGRNAVLVDSNPDAVAVMKRRFAKFSPVNFIGCDDIAVAEALSTKAEEPPRKQASLF
jgi:site-specific DNA-methyltransferase (adenine-specific)